MKFNSHWFASLTGILLMISSAYAKDKDAAPSIKTQKEKISYSVGSQIGTHFKSQGVELDPSAFLLGVKEALAGGKGTLSEEEIHTTLQQFEQEMKAKQMTKMQEASGLNLKQGADFLAKNKEAKGVKVLPSGLQYIELKGGSGKQPTATSTVVAHYRGTLLDGTEFDSSYKRNQPATFPLGNVIKGWQEALPLMKEGGKMKIFVPSALAYGERGTPGGPIPPNATLVFEIELISVQ